MSRLKRVKAIWFGIALTILITAPANAVVIFDSFGPGDIYNTASAIPITGATSINDREDGGFAFVAPLDGVLSSVTVALAAHQGANAIDIALGEDLTGRPGATLEVFHFIALGPFDGSYHEPLMLTASAPLKRGTTYWLIASTPDSSTYGAWYLNSLGLLGTRALVVRDEPDWNIFDYALPAARIVVTEVPTPSALVLFATGLFCFTGLRRNLVLTAARTWLGPLCRLLAPGQFLTAISRDPDNGGKWGCYDWSGTS